MRTLLALLIVGTLPIRDLPAQAVASLGGRWHIELFLDSAGSSRPRPSGRHIQGILALDAATVTPDSVATSMGRFTVDFTPFFSGQVARSSSTTFAGPVTQRFWTEVRAALSLDSVTVDFIPRISHGAISLEGHLAHDSILGQWYERAYCCGASGHFTMVRVSTAPVPFIPDPVPTPPPPPKPAERGEIRVRVWDTATRGFLRLRHGLGQGESSKWAYSTATSPDGWGPSFWLLPGDYTILLDEIPCGSDQQFLEREIAHPFHVVAADTLDITVTINSDSLPLGRSYKNPKAASCSELRRHGSDSVAPN